MIILNDTDQVKEVTYDTNSGTHTVRLEPQESLNFDEQADNGETIYNQVKELTIVGE